MIYKSEIERIWKAQFDSLSRKDEPQLTEEEKEEDAPKARQPSVRQETVPPMSPGAGPSSPASPAFSRGSSLERDREMSMGPESSRRVLRIRRLVCLVITMTRAKKKLIKFAFSRSLANGRRRSSATPLLSARMYAGDKRSRRSRPWQTRLHPRAMPTRTSEPRSGTYLSLGFCFSRDH